jgi:hypothetical protein
MAIVGDRPVNQDQHNLVMATLKSILDAALMSSIWQLPLWLRIIVGTVAFGLLFYIVS